MKRRRRAKAGYSLLEIMVALAVMSLATAMILPGLSTGLGSAARHAAVIELDQQILALRRRVQSDGEPRTLGAAEASQLPANLSLPHGWSYQLDHELTFYPDGACDEGEITLVKGDAAPVRFIVTMPECRPRLA